MKKKFHLLILALARILKPGSVAMAMLLFFTIAWSVELNGSGISPAALIDDPQEKTVTGKVTDLAGNPLPGVSVLVKGTTIGALTDVEGSFRLSVPANARSLSFTFIGMEGQEVEIGNQTNINIVLEETSIGLDEVVVVGYSAERKKDIIGSVAVVDAKNLASIPAGSAAGALQGQASGVTAIGSGQAGREPNIRIRGISTFGDSRPLVLIDGVEGNINDVSASEIESMQILKDAGAASIYGVRGSNGVIVITTKKGKKGAPVITYEGYYGMTYPLPGNPLNLMNSTEFMNTQLISEPAHPLFQEGMPDYTYITPTSVGVAFAGDPEVDPSRYFIDMKNPSNNYQIQKVNQEGTDWYHEVYKKAPRMSHTLTASGGTDLSNYLFSLGVYDEEGTLITSHLKRYSARINTSFSPTKNIRFGENINLFYKDNPLLPITVEAGEFSSLGLHLNLMPIIPVYDIAGNWGGTRAGPRLGTQRNPVAWFNAMNDDRNYSWNTIGNAFLEVDFLNHFTARTSIGGSLTNGFAQSFYRKEYYRSEFYNNPNKYTESFYYANRVISTTTLAYVNKFGQHDINIIAGVETIRNYRKGMGGSRDGYAIELFDFMTLSSGTSNVTNYSTISEDKLLSQFGKLSYNYAGKYLLGVTLRRDGSSKFGPENRFGFFPSFSLGWRISQEKFMGNLEWMDDLKLRASYGILGSQANVGADNQFDLYGSNFTSSYYDINGTSNSIVQGFYQSVIGNKATGWERDVVANIGLDFTIFKTLTFEIEAFKKSINGLLFSMPLPATVGGASKPIVNIGDIQNTGFDFTGKYRRSFTKDLGISIIANISKYKNEVVDVPDPGYFDGGTGTRNQEGHPVGSFFGYKVVKIFSSAEEVASSPTQDGALPGRFMYQDINLDGKISTDDRTFIGDPNPDFTYGFNIDVSFKNFDLSTNFYGSKGNDVYNYLMNYTHDWGGYESNKSRDMLDAWTPDNLDAKHPRIENDNGGGFSGAGQMSSYKIFDGSFFRMKSLILGYRVPTSVTERFHASSLRLYGQVTNLFTITSYPGYDPELQGTSTLFGIDMGPYPSNQRSFLFGVNLSF
jgi:TonB-linked SusC/RagA family outer membrane protein